jgi:hypothetical protein
MAETYHHEYMLLSIDKSLYHYDLHPNHPLLLGENAEIGVKSVFMWFTYPNISEKYQNNKVKLYFDEGWHEYTIPTGMYEVSALSEYLNLLILLAKSDNDEALWTKKDQETYLSLIVNQSTFKCRVLLRPNIMIDFSDGGLHELLGLEQKIYTNSEEGPNIINITRGVDRVLLRCNLVERRHQKDIRDVLYDILPIADPGAAILEQMNNVEYYKCRDEQVRRIEIRVTDKKNNLIDLLEPISLKIVFRYKDK